jgi:hypothetical protein
MLIRMKPADRDEFIAAAPVNLRPVGDDSPFFFETSTLSNYLRRNIGWGQPDASLFEIDDPVIRKELGRASRTSKGGSVWLKSGYGPLLIALAQATVLSALFILLPLAKLRLEVRESVPRFAIVGYFSMLGLAFVLAELMFIQKHMIFLGGPTYSLAISLFAILVSSGLGAFATKRIRIDSPRIVAGIVLAVVVLLAGYNFYLRDVLPHLLDLGFGQRVVVAVLALGPVSFLMGMPFPLGIRMLAEMAPNMIPWAWGCNACMTVIGSVTSVVLAMNWGFFAALNAAAACYLIASILMLWIARPAYRVSLPSP